MAIHEDRRMFDMKSPENSGNWLGLFWVRSSGHISDCGMKRERPRGAAIDGGEADQWLLRSKLEEKTFNKMSNKSERM